MPPPAEPIPTALPVVVPLRQRVAELCGSMALAAVLAGLLVHRCWAAAAAARTT